jgi:hypothetical protein
MVKGTNVAFFLANHSEEATKFHEDYNNPEPETRVKLRVAICT